MELNIDEVLTLIQNEVKVPKGLMNKFGNYKYRSAEQILEAVKPILKAHGATLMLTDDIVLIGNKYFLKSTAIFNYTGIAIEVNGFAELSEHKGMSSEQCTGTASSYARKYALNGLLLIDETESDPDNKDNSEPKKQAAKKESKSLDDGDVVVMVNKCKDLATLNALYKELSPIKEPLLAIFSKRKKEITDGSANQ